MNEFITIRERLVVNERRTGTAINAANANA